MRPRAICGTRKTSQIKLNAPVKPRETAPRPGHPPAATSASTSASTATTAPSTLADPRGWPPMQPPPPAARGHSFGLGLGHARALPALPPPPATAATAHNPLKRRQLLPPDAPGGFRPASYPSHPLASASHPHTSAGYPHASAGYPHAAGALPGVSALLQPAHRKRSLSGGSAAPVVAPRPRVASPPPGWEPASPRSVYLNLVDRSAMTPRGHPLAGHGHPHGLSPYASTPASARLVNQHPVYGQPPASAASPQSDASAGAVHDKPSRYLREMDRRVILARIDRGEKQSALAKEFRVSRAAICNLYKHRDEVLSRKDGNPLAKHPKKPRPKGSAASKKLKPSTSTAAAAPAVHQLRTRAAALLLTTLRKKHADARTVRRSAARLVRLVLEEALALVPMKAVDIELGSGDRADGVTLEHPPCALAVVPAADAAHPMLDVFADMEPEQPAGRVLAANPKCPRLEGKNLPPTLEFHNVFLLELTADDADRAIAAVRLALERGAVESMISIVTLAIAREVVDELRVVFPAVRVVAAQIVEETDGSDGVDADAFRARLAIVDE